MIVPLFLDTCEGRDFSKASRQAVTEVCQSAEAEIRRHLGALPPEMELACQTGAMVIPETGEMGMAMTPTRVGWTVDPAAGRIADLARTQLRFTLFHELHHLARGWVMHGGAERTSFMEGVVSEGLATVFERDVGGRETPWGQYPEDVGDWVADLLQLPLSAPYFPWMFQHPDGRRWIGYRAGTYIAERAIQASGRSAAELARVPTSEVLRLAGVGTSS